MLCLADFGHLAAYFMSHWAAAQTEDESLASLHCSRCQREVLSCIFNAAAEGVVLRGCQAVEP